MAIYLIESQERLLFSAQVNSFAMKDRSYAKLEVKASADLSSAIHTMFRSKLDLLHLKFWNGRKLFAKHPKINLLFSDKRTEAVKYCFFYKIKKKSRSLEGRIGLTQLHPEICKWSNISIFCVTDRHPRVKVNNKKRVQPTWMNKKALRKIKKKHKLFKRFLRTKSG